MRCNICMVGMGWVCEGCSASDWGHGCALQVRETVDILIESIDCTLSPGVHATMIRSY